MLRIERGHQTKEGNIAIPLGRSASGELGFGVRPRNIVFCDDTTVSFLDAPSSEVVYRAISSEPLEIRNWTPMEGSLAGRECFRITVRPGDVIRLSPLVEGADEQGRDSHGEFLIIEGTR